MQVGPLTLSTTSFRGQLSRQVGALLRPFLLSSVLLLLGATGAEALPNLLRLSNMGDAFGVIREQRLVDGRVPSPESPINDFVATLFLESGAYVRFDLECDKSFIAQLGGRTDDQAHCLVLGYLGLVGEPTEN